MQGIRRIHFQNLAPAGTEARRFHQRRPLISKADELFHELLRGNDHLGPQHQKFFIKRFRRPHFIEKGIHGEEHQPPLFPKLRQRRHTLRRRLAALCLHQPQLHMRRGQIDLVAIITAVKLLLCIIIRGRYHKYRPSHACESIEKMRARPGRNPQKRAGHLPSPHNFLQTDHAAGCL